MPRRVFRRVAAAIVVACAAVVLASSALAVPGRPAVALSPLERGVLADINAFRVAQHLSALRLSSQLTAAAAAHTREMAVDGYFAHSSADGSAYWKRIGTFYAASPRTYWSVGENLLWAPADINASGALALWLNDPEHRANLMNPRWREIGVAAMHASAAPGIFHGLDVTIVTTDFGARH